MAILFPKPASRSERSVATRSAPTRSKAGSAPACLRPHCLRRLSLRDWSQTPSLLWLVVLVLALAYTGTPLADSKSADLRPLGVRFPLPAPQMFSSVRLRFPVVG